MDKVTVPSSQASTIGELQKLPGFNESVVNFLDNLVTFASSEAARLRLIGTNHAFFLGQPYFEDDTVTKILRLPTSEGTLEKQLQDLAQKKLSKGGNAPWCSSHDLFPVYERAFQFDYKSWKNGIDYRKWRKNRELKAKNERS